MSFLSGNFMFSIGNPPDCDQRPYLLHMDIYEGAQNKGKSGCVATGKGGSSAFSHNAIACPGSRFVAVPSLYPWLSRESLTDRSLHFISGVCSTAVTLLYIKNGVSHFILSIVRISVTYPYPMMRAFLGEKWEETFGVQI